MATLFSIGFIVLGVVFFCIGLTGPVCPVHGDESLEFMAVGVVGIATGTCIALIGIAFGKKKETIEIETSKETEQEEEPDEKKDDKYFYNMLMDDDVAYEECVKNWQNHIQTSIVVKDKIFQIPETVIEDVMSEREIVFPKRVGES